jgi:hypothetical protein
VWLADGPSNTTAIVIAVITGVFTLSAAVVTSLWLFKGSARNTDAEGHKSWDQRVDAELTALRARCAALEQANDILQTKLMRARWVLIYHKIDPDELDR